MEHKPSRFAFLSHIPPLATALAALVMLALTPIWAYQFYQQPFVGALLEPNNIVSQIKGNGWPAHEAGVVWPEQLTAVNGTPVTNAAEVNALLAANGDAPVWLEFLQQAGAARRVLVTPVHMPLGDFVTLFVIPYLVGVIFLVIGLWAYRLRASLRASRSLLMFTAAVSIAASAFFDMNTTHHVVILWACSLSAAAGSCIHLALEFPQQMRFVERYPAARFVSWALSLAIVVPVVKEILFPTSPLAYIMTWQYSYAYMAVAIGFFLVALTWRILRSDSPVVRQQSRVIIFGAALAFAPIGLFYFLPTAFSSSPPEFRASLYFPLLILLPLSVTYAILRYRLLDVDRVLASILKYAITMAAALAVFYGLLTVISLALRQAVQADNPLVIAVYLLALVLGFSPLLRLVQRAIDRTFYRSPADYRRVLNELSSSLVVTPNLERTLHLLTDQLQKALAPEEFVVYLYDDDRALYVPHSRGEREFPSLPADDPIVQTIRDAAEPLWFPPNAALPPGLEGSAEYHSLGCSAFIALRYEGSLTGFLALGLRRSGEPYTSEDLDFLDTVAGQSALALENARLFTNLRRTLDQTLEMKNLMDDIFASIATGVITTDVEQKITLFNQAAEFILGIPMKDVLGKSLPDALPSLCPDLEMVAEDALTRGTVTLSRDVNRLVPLRGNLFLRLSCSPLRDAYLATKGTTIVFEDLTERRRLEAEQERIRQTFGRVVAPRVRDRLLADAVNLNLDGTRQKATILFADLSGFTSFSETTEPETLFKVLNYYLSLAAQAILEEEGTLDKFMGDAVMALWNTPDPQADHSLRAVRAALSILERSRHAHAHIKDPRHHLQFRIGVTTGDAMVGNVGTSELFNYTAIGDTVNLAQRLEVAAHPGQILMDHVTYQAVAGKVTAEPLEPMQIKGKTQPVAVYELKSLK
ncbi:MAG: putative adenylate/guanylate cyclase [Anaerolineaceae bacterium]|nr:MAG: putative adenylate/guanylate cyclase [Anaerolineaceae bacterium]